MEKTVDDFAKAIGDQVEYLTKSLSDNMLAGVAVIVGTFIAAIFASTFNATVFRLGMGVYATYLAVFPLWLGLRSLRQRYTSTIQDFEKRKETFGTLLPPAQVEDIIGNSVEGKKRLFEDWVGIARGAYVVFFVLLLIGAFLVPSIIVSSSPTTITPTPTLPIVTPTP
jgi:hypothetical protein